MMRRSRSLERLSADKNDRCDNDLHHSSKANNLRGSLLSSSFMTSSGWFSKGKADNTSSTTNEATLKYQPQKAKSSRRRSSRASIGSSSADDHQTSSPQEQQKLRVQEIRQSHCLEQSFLSKMRESGVMTSAGYQAVLHDFLVSDREVTTATAVSGASNKEAQKSTSSTKIDRRAEMLKARKLSSKRSSCQGGSSRRFSSFFTACASYCDDEDLLAAAADFSNDAPDTTTAASATIVDRRGEMRRSSRKNSSRRFGSFFTAAGGGNDDEDFLLDLDHSDRVEANIAPLKRSIQLTQEQIDYVQSAANDYDNLSRRWTMQSSSISMASSLSDSIHISSDRDDDEGSIERLEKCIESGGSKDASLSKRDSSNSLNLEDIFDGTEGSRAVLSPMPPPVPSDEKPSSASDEATSEVSTTDTRRKCTASVNFDPTQCKKNEAPSSSEQQEKSNLESSESSIDECVWLPWPEQHESTVEDKDNESFATKQTLYDDNSFLPWPDSPVNGRAKDA